MSPFHRIAYRGSERDSTQAKGSQLVGDGIFPSGSQAAYRKPTCALFPFGWLVAPAQ